jgi:hypothetical protein
MSPICQQETGKESNTEYLQQARNRWWQALVCGSDSAIRLQEVGKEKSGESKNSNSDESKKGSSGGSKIQ